LKKIEGALLQTLPVLQPEPQRSVIYSEYDISSSQTLLVDRYCMLLHAVQSCTTLHV
jgi:hypothetical protein